jgi:hypothetical protein
VIDVDDLFRDLSCLYLKGERFRSAILSWGVPTVQQVRGLGLLNAVVVQGSQGSGAQQWNSVDELTWGICMRMAELGTADSY